MGVSFLLVGTGLLTSLLSIRGGLEGFDTQALGLLGTAFFAGYLAGNRLAPALIRRIGHIRAFSFFTAAIACMTLLHELLLDAWFWAFLRFLTGAAMASLYTIIESWLNSYAQPAQRSKIFSVYTTVCLGSLAFAPHFLHWASPNGHTLFAIAAALTCAAVMPVSATSLSQPAIANVPALGLRTLYAKAPIAFVSALFSGLAQGALWGLTVVWATQTGMDNSSVATYMSLCVIGGALLQWPIGRLTDRIDRGSVISLTALAAAIVATPMFFADGQYHLFLFVGGFIYGGLAFTLYPLAVARMMDRLTPGEVFSGNGALLLTFGIGAAVSPLLVGSAMKHFGTWAMPAWYILVEIALAIVAWQLARQAPANIGEQTQFVPMVRTGAEAIAILATEQSANLQPEAND